MKKGLGYKEELVSYVKSNLKKGYTKESLRWALVNQGHAKIEIENAIDKAQEEMGREAPIMSSKPKVSYEVEPANISHKEPEKQSFWKKLFG